jgi:hypothetical protein
MARYIDRHPTNPNLPPEVITIIRQRLQRAEPDEFGERGINVFIGADQTYCYREAPNAEAVRKAHEAMGIVVGPEDITEVQVLP